MKYDIASLVGPYSSTPDRMAIWGVEVGLASPLALVVGVLGDLVAPQMALYGLFTFIWVGSWAIGGLLSSGALSGAGRSEHPDSVRKKGYIGIGIAIAHFLLVFAAFWVFLATLLPEDWPKALLGIS